MRNKSSFGVAEALSAAAKSQPQLAILDIMLPDGNGFDLMEQLKRQSDYPILFFVRIIVSDE